MNIKIFSPLILLTLLLSTGACSHKLDDANNATASTASEEIWMPGHQELPALKKEALAGSPRAAMQLSLWYMKFPSGKDNDYYWTQIAAENGSAAGQFNLAHKLLADPTEPLNTVRARYWLTLSAKQGAKEATAKLAELDGAKKR